MKLSFGGAAQAIDLTVEFGIARVADVGRQNLIELPLNRLNLMVRDHQGVFFAVNQAQLHDLANGLKPQLQTFELQGVLCCLALAHGAEIQRDSLDRYNHKDRDAGDEHQADQFGPAFGFSGSVGVGRWVP